MTPKTTSKFILLLLVLFLSVSTQLQAQFITTWITTDGTIVIPTNSASGTYNYTVTWTNLTSAGVGNGTISGRNGNHTITGLTNGNTYSVAITGVFPHFYMNSNSVERSKIRTIAQWGTNTWNSMESSFSGCSNLTYTATDTPNLSGVTNMQNMFASCALFNGNIGNWNTTSITSMRGMFWGASVFNQNIGSWNTANVTTMQEMFFLATAFNQNIGGWNTARVTNMMEMFRFAAAFNQDIGGWNTANVTTMSHMFVSTDNFNQNLNNWNTANVRNMNAMFWGARAFNGNISSWNTSNLTSMVFMFANATAFNQDISFKIATNSWNTVNVLNMGTMFYDASNFNQNIGNWNTTNVRDMSGMFERASSFNQNINTWNTSSVTTMSDMFSSAISFNQNIGSWNTINVRDMKFMFAGAFFFNQNISNWNTTNVTDMKYMFWRASAYNQNIVSWNTANIIDMSGMFLEASAFNQNLGSLNVTNVANMSVMLDRSGLSTASYDATLIGWAAQNVKPNVFLGALNLRYCAGTVARTSLINTKSWTINGDAPLTASISPTTTILPGGVIGTSYSSNITQTGFTGAVTWSISTGALPAGLSIDMNTGVISGTPTNISTSNFTVMVASGACSQTRTYSINVCPVVTIFPAATLVNIPINVGYNQTISQTGLTGVLTWSVSTGTLPTGLALNATNGIISGSPTTNVTSTFRIQVTNGACTQTKVYNIIVGTGSCPTLTFINTIAPECIIDTPYGLDASVTGATGIIYSVNPNLPAGISINSSTGLITGTTNALLLPATYVITATKGVCNVTQSYTFSVNAQRAFITTWVTTQMDLSISL